MRRVGAARAGGDGGGPGTPYLPGAGPDLDQFAAALRGPVGKALR
ncbi:hypothetical protein [Streptomyces silvensis]|nr:hypothetical protein [Streptomyces silvensis]